MSTEPTPASKPDTWNLPGITVRLCALWLAVGALFKLFLGTPGDLPKAFVELLPIPVETAFPLVISAELALVVLAMARPAWAWIPLTGLFLFFEFLLSQLIAAGATSCGCMGGTIEISPVVMAVIDGVLLLAMLASRPWARRAGPDLSLAVLALGLVIAAVVPWLYIEKRTSGPEAEFVVIHPERWVNQVIYDVAELQQHMHPGDVEKLPTDGFVILWRQSCEHCAAHLHELANDKVKNDGSRPIVLLQILDDLENARVVTAMPQGPHVSELQFKQGPQFAIQAPWEIVVEGGLVTAALDEEHAKALKAATPPGQ